MSDELVQCPYDVSHKIIKKRFQTHLIRCKKNFPNSKKVTCPFNVTHIMDPEQLDEHVKVCENRKSFEAFKMKETPIVTTNDPPPPIPENSEYHEENWDDLAPVPTYNPHAYAASANVIRNLQGVAKSKKKEFRERERLRLNELNKK